MTLDTVTYPGTYSPSNFRPCIIKKMQVATEFDIVKMVLDKNFSAAYAMPLGRAKVILSSPNMRQNNVPYFHIVKEYIGLFIYPPSNQFRAIVFF